MTLPGRPPFKLIQKAGKAVPGVSLDNDAGKVRKQSIPRDDHRCHRPGIPKEREEHTGYLDIMSQFTATGFDPEGTHVVHITG
jgi:hypothetical protein